MLYRGAAPVSGYWPAVTAVLDRWYPGFAGADGLLEDTVSSPATMRTSAAPARSSPTTTRSMRGRSRRARSSRTPSATPTPPPAGARGQASLQAPFEAAFWDASAGAFQDSPVGAGRAPPGRERVRDPRGARDPARRPPRRSPTSTAPRGSAGATRSPTRTPGAPRRATTCRRSACSRSSPTSTSRRGSRPAPTPPRSTSFAGRGAGCSPPPPGRAAPTGRRSAPAARSTATSAPRRASRPAGRPGALPALTNDVLGIRPTGPGFSTFDAIPHPSGLAWAQGSVPTPAGPITFGFKRIARRLRAPARGAAASRGAGRRAGREPARPRRRQGCGDRLRRHGVLRGSHVIEVVAHRADEATVWVGGVHESAGVLEWKTATRCCRLQLGR